MARAKTDAGVMPMIGAGALFLCGAAHGLLATQFLIYWWLDGVELAAVVAIGAAGLGAMGVSFALGQARSWAAIAGAVMAPLMGLASAAFSAWAMYHLSFALYMFFAPPAALLATVLVPLAIGPCRAAEKAQAEVLAKHGDRMFGSLR